MSDVKVHYDLVYLVCARLISKSYNIQDLDRNYDIALHYIKRAKKQGCPLAQDVAELIASVYLYRHIAIECSA